MHACYQLNAIQAFCFIKESLMDKIGMLMTELNTLQTQCEILEESKAENESIKTSQETVQGETVSK